MSAAATFRGPAFSAGVLRMRSPRMQDRVPWVLRVIRELDRVFEKAVGTRRIDPVDSHGTAQDAERELRVCRDTLRAAVDAMEELAGHVREEALRYRALIEFVPYGYLETDLESVIRCANAEAAHLLRRPQEVLYGKPLLGFVADGDFATFLREHAVQGAGATAIATRAVVLRPRESEPLRASISIGPLRGKAGERIGFRFVLRASVTS